MFYRCRSPICMSQIIRRQFFWWCLPSALILRRAHGTFSEHTSREGGIRMDRSRFGRLCAGIERLTARQLRELRRRLGGSTRARSFWRGSTREGWRWREASIVVLRPCSAGAERTPACRNGRSRSSPSPIAPGRSSARPARAKPRRRVRLPCRPGRGALLGRRCCLRSIHQDAGAAPLPSQPQNRPKGHPHRLPHPDHQLPPQPLRELHEAVLLSTKNLPGYAA